MKDRVKSSFYHLSKVNKKTSFLGKKQITNVKLIDKMVGKKVKSMPELNCFYVFYMIDFALQLYVHFLLLHMNRGAEFDGNSHEKFFFIRGVNS